MADYDATAREALAISERIQRLLAGRGPDAQGVILAELVSLWLAGHHPELRTAVFAQWLILVRQLTDVNAKILRPEHPAEH